MIAQRILLLLAVAGTVVACSKDDVQTPGEPDKNLVLTFEAGTSEVEADVTSRAGYDGLKSIWHANDEVGLTVDVNNKNLHFTQEPGSLSADGTRVRYTGTLNQAVSGSVNAVAYYPYSSTSTVSGQTISTTFPATQTYNAAGGYKGIPVFAAYTGNYNSIRLPFRNLFSVIKLTLSKGLLLTNTTKLQQIVFKGNNNETVSGPMSVNLSPATPVVQYSGSGKTITLDCGTGVELTTTPKTFYIAVPAINYTKGYSFTFITDKGQVTKSAKSTGASYAVNKIYSAPPLTIDNLSIVIPDLNLRAALESLGLISILDQLLGHVSITAAGLLATSIDISAKGIADLTGISNFPALLTLNAGNNNLVSVDLSKLTLLTNLDLSQNQLSNLDLSLNTKLVSLNLSTNALTALDVSNNTDLKTLLCGANNLTSLNLSANTKLESLNCMSNNLTSLNLSANTALTGLNCSSNELGSLNLTANTALTNLNCGSNELTSLNLAVNTKLTDLVCSNNQIPALNLATNTLLATLDCSSNLLSTLDLHNNVLLNSVTCYGNNLATLNISGLNLLNTLHLNSSGTNNIAALKLTIPTNATVQNLLAEGMTGSLWTSFECLNNTTIQGISLKNNIKLLSVNASGNTNLASLDVSGNLLQTTLRTSGSTLTTLNFSGVKVLAFLYLDTSNTNCINLLRLTVPTTAKIRHIIADAALIVGTWTSFTCSNNTTIQTISLKNNIGLLNVTLNNNTALTSLDVTGSAIVGLTGIVQSGNASGFTVTGAL